MPESPLLFINKKPESGTLKINDGQELTFLLIIKSSLSLTIQRICLCSRNRLCFNYGWSGKLFLKRLVIRPVLRIKLPV